MDQTAKVCDFLGFVNSFSFGYFSYCYHFHCLCSAVCPGGPDNICSGRGKCAVSVCVCVCVCVCVRCA